MIIIDLSNIQNLHTAFQPKSRKQYFGKTNVDRLRSILANINCVFDINFRNSNSYKIVNNALETTVPLVKLCCDMSPAWFTPQLERLRYIKSR